jgi:Transposase, Mutator family
VRVLSGSRSTTRERTAVRHGHEDGEVTLGGRRVEVRRPRLRAAGGAAEVPLGTYEHLADRDRLGRVVLERMLAGVSTSPVSPHPGAGGEQVEVRARSTSKSAVSRSFVERTREALGELMSRRLADLRLAGMMLDSLEPKGRMMMIVALGITLCNDQTGAVVTEVPRRPWPPLRREPQRWPRGRLGSRSRRLDLCPPADVV